MKPTVVVRLEDTLSENYDTMLYYPGTVKTHAEQRLRALHSAYRIVIVTPLANDQRGLKIVQQWLTCNGLDCYDEIWQGYGFPHSDVTIDDEAQTL